MKHLKTLRVLLIALVLTALMCAPALAMAVSPGPDFYYLDNANVLSQELEGEIYFSNKLLYEACGAQIVVVTVDTTGREAIDDYAYDLFNEWGIGDAAKNNGFLLLLAIDDDDYYARTGSGIDRSFSASAIKDYFDKYLEEDFVAKRYEAGVKKFFEAVFKRIADTYNVKITVQDGIAAYKDYIAKNSAAEDFGGYTGSRRKAAVNEEYRDYVSYGGGFGIGVVVFVVLLIILIVVLSKGRRARRRVGVMPPPPPVGGGFGYRPTRVVHHTTYVPTPPRRSSGGFGGGASRPSGGGASRSSFGGGGASRSSFGGGGRSSGFGGGHSGGGHTSGGGAGRGRH